MLVPLDTSNTCVYLLAVLDAVLKARKWDLRKFCLPVFISASVFFPLPDTCVKPHICWACWVMACINGLLCARFYVVLF